MDIKRIWLIGDSIHSMLPCGVIRDGFRNLGIYVYHTDPSHIVSKIEEGPNAQYYLNCRNFYHLSPPDDLEFDIVFVDHFMPLRIIVETTKPIIYWHREQYQLPSCGNPNIILWANPESAEYMRTWFPNLFTNVFLQLDMPLAVNMQHYIAPPVKIAGIHFTGATETNGTEDWIFKSAYKERNRIIKACNQFAIDGHYVKSYGYKTLEEWRESMPNHEAQLVIFGRTPMGLRLFELGCAKTIPVIWCQIEDMEFDVQAYYERLGFKGKYWSDGQYRYGPESNCFFFSHLDQLPEYYQLTPELKAVIAQNAYTLIKERHTHIIRVKQIIAAFEQADLEKLQMIQRLSSDQNPIVQYKRIMSKQFWDWRQLITNHALDYTRMESLYNHSPNGPATVYTHCHQNEILSEYALLPQEWMYMKRKMRASLCFDVAVHPNYRKQGYFTQLGKHAMEREAMTLHRKFSLGFPNKRALKGHLKVGWQILGPRPILKWAHTDDSRNALQRAIMERNHLEVPKEIIIKPLDRFIDAPYLQKNLNPQYICEERTDDWLNWRFGHKDYVCFGIWNLRSESCQSRMVGHMVFSLYVLPNTQVKLQLIELWLPTDRNDLLFDRMLLFWTDLAGKFGVDYIDMMINPTLDLTHYLMDNGFEMTFDKEQPIIYFAHTKNLTFKYEDFYWMYADTDNY